MKIFIDMDNVVVNLDETVINIANEENNTNYNYKDNREWWWDDYITTTNKGSRRYFENMLLRKGVFLNAKPVEDAVYYINKLNKLGHEIIFLTSPQWVSNFCVFEKVNWLKLHFWTWFDPDKHLVMTTRKELLCRKNENNILIDDSTKNLDKWGGIKICKGTSCNRNYQGLRAENWEEIYKLIQRIEKGE